MAVPFDQMEGMIWFDGKLVPGPEAKIHVLTHGLHYASAVFEGERAYNGVIFKGTEHSERLVRSAVMLDFEIPYSVAEIDAAKRLVVERSGQKDAYVRPIAWRGSEQLGVSAQNNRIHLVIAAWEWPSYFDPAQRLKGIRLDLADYRRPDPRTIPCLAKAAGLYMICTISKHRAERRGYADAMMLDWEGRVSNMKASESAMKCGFSSISEARAKVTASGPCAVMQLCRLPPPGTKPSALAS
jgi:branched-chain amino acid aminotransferase